MKQEEKELLFVDLCARLPYGVKVNAQYKDGDGWKTEDRKILGLYEDGQVYLDCVYTTIDCIKPYLRPMSSMTEDERKEYNDIVKNTIDFYDCPKSEEICFFIIPIDWLNAHHFDYRGLIEKGLAIEVTEEMYNIKEQ